MAGAGDKDTETSLREAFGRYCTKKDQMTTKDLTQWMTHAGLLKKTGNFSSNNIDITFSSCKTKGQNCITFDQCKEVIKKLTKVPKDEAKSAAECQKACEKLGRAKKEDVLTSKTSKTGGVDRLTDASKYTGSHKERFDESGKGKGAEGRTEKADTSGYVGNYKGAGTYDKK